MNTDRLKFRVFDKRANKYISARNLFVDGNGDLKVHEVHWGVWDAQARCNGFRKPNTGYLVIEQCTGLKDANGKLVYEGDIIGMPFTPVVKWDYSRSCFVFDDGNPQPPLVNRAILQMCLVIGNIHENPELLEGKK